MATNIYEPKFMIQMLEQQPPMPSFIKDTFFRRTQTFPTKNVEFDVKKGGMAMAPFVSPRIGSKVLERTGFKTQSYKPPLVAPKRVLTTDDIASRLPGEPVYNGYNPNRRRVELLQSDLIELDESITRREEWMCTQVMFNAEIPVVGEGVSDLIEFEFDNTVVVDIPWSDYVNSQPIIDLKNARKLVGRSGFSAAVAVGDSDTMWNLTQNEKIQKLLDNTRYEMGIIAPKLLENGAMYIGFLRKANLHLYSYEGEFADNENENPEFPGIKPEDKGFVPAVYSLVPKGKVVVAPANNFPAKMLYAVIHDLQIGSFARKRVPKQWDQQEPSERYVKISSALLPCPQSLDAWAVLDVGGTP
ncbi:MAG: major capsid protein [Oscillospiraceae bacterium]|nr:major capsid protein [Oscillospiraceae bacterium]